MAPSLISYPSKSVSSLLSSLAFVSVQNIPLGLKFFLGICSTALATCILNFNLVTTVQCGTMLLSTLSISVLKGSGLDFIQSGFQRLQGRTFFLKFFSNAQATQQIADFFPSWNSLNFSQVQSYQNLAEERNIFLIPVFSEHFKIPTDC